MIFYKTVKYADLFSKKKAKTAFSLKDLVQLTSEFSVKNAKGCTASLISSDYKELYLKYRVKCSLKGSDPKGHEVRIRFDTSKIDDNSGIKNLDVKVSCSCPAFLWWGQQYNLGEGDALEGQPRPLYQAPTDPQRFQNVICKHIKVVSDRIAPYVNRLLVKYKDDQVEKILEKHEEPNEEPSVKLVEEQETPSKKSPAKKPTKKEPDKQEELLTEKNPSKEEPITPKQKALNEMQGPSSKKPKKEELEVAPEEEEEDTIIEPTVKPTLAPKQKALNEMQGPGNNKDLKDNLNVTKPVIE